MANVQRHLKHDPKTIAVPVAAATVIEIGDLVGDDGSGNVVPASSITWNTTLAATQADFKAVFLGVAMTASAADETEPVTVGTSGVWGFDAASADYDVGTLVGPDEDPASTLADQTVETAVITSAIGEVVKDTGAAATHVRIRIFELARHGAP